MSDLPWGAPLTPANPAAVARKHKHVYVLDPVADLRRCASCPKVRDEDVARRNRNNSTRGGREELTVARLVGGRKVGPMGWPWDVEGPGCRLQVKKLATRPSINAITEFIEDIPFRTDSLRGFVWVAATGQGRKSERTVFVSRREWFEWHGVSSPSYPSADLLSMSLADFVELHCGAAAA